MQARLSPAKDVLNSLEEKRAQVGRLRRVVKRMESQCSPSVSNPGVVARTASYGKRDQWEALADQRTYLQREERELRELEDLIDSWIDLLPRHRWRMVLRSYYLDSLSLENVARELTRTTGREFSTTQVYRLRRQALLAADEIWPLQ